jgi:energy-coupling factor transport system ATP-binding protein
MIGLHTVSFRYPGSAQPVLHDIELRVAEGELCLVIGQTGSGKSTLLQLVNGLAPHFTGGVLSGTVTVAGRDTRTHPPRDLADLIGVVGQDPLAGFVTSTVDEELAYGMEQLGIPAAVMRTRVEEVVDLLGLADVRERTLAGLSGGQQQRVAIGSVLTSHPRLLVLDEPTSALDPTAAEEVLATIVRLVHDLGLTVLLAEHRLERVVQYVDSIIQIHPDGTATHGDPAEILAITPQSPPIVDLGLLAGWHPLPLSVRDARRRAAPLREALRAVDQAPPEAAHPAGGQRDVVATVHHLEVRYGSILALRDVNLRLHRGEVAVLMGRNGSGKSSLLWALQGSGLRSRGTIALTVTGALATETGRRRPVDPARLDPADATGLIALVPQTPADLLYLETVEAECVEADRASGASPGSALSILAELAPGIAPQRHPRDLSEGQRLALALAVQLAGSPAILLLDEPTRGLDYSAKRRLCAVVKQRAAAGTSILLSSHDVEFVARVAERIIVLANGEIVADGPAPQILTASPALSPQVTKILQPLPQPLLTVDAVQSALEGVHR